MSRPSLATALGGNSLAWLVALAAVWLWTWHHLAVEWRFNDSYNYGFAVPVLAAWIAWRRWRSQVHPSSPALTSAADGVAASSSPPSASLGILLAAWLVLLLAELLRQQDPTWRLTGWLMTGGASLLTGTWLYRLGGQRLLRKLLFAIAFAWLALPWPSLWENRVTQTLMRAVTATVVNALNWTGVAAVQHGNVIELSRGLVGVDTACSGVQSLQASLMVAVFLGELYWLQPWRRVALVIVGWALALLGNLLRVFLITRAVASEGASGLTRYHDPIGYAITSATFLGAWFIAARLSRGLKPTATCSRRFQPATTGVQPAAAEFNLRLPDFSLHGHAGYALLVAVALIPVLAAVWFRSVPGRDTLSIQNAPRWSLDSGELAPGWRATAVNFAPAERAALRFSRGEGLWVASPAGWTAEVLHFFWKPRAQVPSLAFSHTPDICMPSAGWTQVGAAMPVTVRVRNLVLPCLLYRFRLGLQDQAVLHTIWYGGRPEPLGDPSWSGAARESRLGALWRGPFRRGHEVVTVFMPETGAPEAQVRLGEELLRQVLVSARR